MKNLHIISVGKIKDPLILKLEAEFHKRLPPGQLEILETKALDDDTLAEGQKVIEQIEDKKLTKAHFFLLTEKGKLYDSREFSSLIAQKNEQKNQLVFLIGGAAGHGQNLLEYLKTKDMSPLSLSPLTFPHRLARLILIEQLYRASTIQAGHPYHK
jgi:23S rRNA (pseudouridine1915-N3)-methyltransferase